jgi:hypothetical protein
LACPAIQEFELRRQAIEVDPMFFEDPIGLIDSFLKVGHRGTKQEALP